MRILLIEDEESLGECIRLGLTQCKYVVDWVKNGADAWSAIQSEHFDMVILDLGLPKVSGEEILKNMRAKGISTPVIILTAKDNVTDLVTGLDFGADDYIYKSFDLKELYARIRAIQRRATICVSPILSIGNITLNLSTRKVYKSKKEIDLSRREFILLQMLMEKVEHVFSRKQLIQSMYGWGDDINSNALEVHIHNLRKKLGNKTIKTVRGIGYTFEKQKK
jgi:two-component system response regulator QseB